MPWYHGALAANSSFRSQQSKEFDVVILGHIKKKRTDASIWLVAIISIFPVNYLLAMFGCYGSATTIAFYLIVSLITKGSYAAIAMEIHFNLLLDNERALNEVNMVKEVRRSFMKLVFHEVCRISLLCSSKLNNDSLNNAS